MNKIEIIKEINNNNVVILPTDTVYGIMARFNKENETKINVIKNSDINKKVSVIFSDVKSLIDKIDIKDEKRLELIKDKLPGKYTFIVNLKKDFCMENGFDRTDFGVRVTTNEELEQIIKETFPLLASSCNITSKEICSTKEEIQNTFDLPLYYTKKGSVSASTIIDLTKEEIKTIRL